MDKHSSTPLTEESIRPAALFDEYLELAAKDAYELSVSEGWEETKCFCCESEGVFAFEKYGFSYRECTNCQSIFCSPRPSKSLLSFFYQNGESPKYWGREFYRQTAESRREKLWGPKAKKVLSHIKKHQPGCSTVIDIGGGYGIFAEEMQRIFNGKVIVIEPSEIMAEECRRKRLNVVEKFFEEVVPKELPVGPKCFTTFELFEHVQDPEEFLKNVFDLMSPGDLLFLTTLSSMGVDIRSLGIHSKAIFPPHHLNFPNPKSIAMLGQSVGFSLISIETPGQLDLDIMKKNQAYLTDPFWKSVLKYADGEELAKLQRSIAELGYSSHMQILFQKS